MTDEELCLALYDITFRKCITGKDRDVISLAIDRIKGVQ